MTSKQRAYLRGLANKIDAIFQVGKNGISDNLIRQVNDALEARELIKLFYFSSFFFLLIIFNSCLNSFFS